MSIDELQREHQVWCSHNFPTADATQQLFGIIEEVGELTHAYLKMKQGIRGTREDHLDAMVDALGDISIYLLGYLTFRGISWEQITRHCAVDRLRGTGERDANHYLLLIAKVAGRLAGWQDISNQDEDTYRYTFTRLSGNLVGYLSLFAEQFDWDLAMIIHDTWQGVKERDWQKNTVDGTAIEEPSTTFEEMSSQGLSVEQ